MFTPRCPNAGPTGGAGLACPPLICNFIKEKLKLKSGSSEPGRNIVKSISKKQLEEIAKEKMADLNAHDIEQAAKIIAGSARSMGIEVKD